MIINLLPRVPIFRGISRYKYNLYQRAADILERQRLDSLKNKKEKRNTSSAISFGGARILHSRLPENYIWCCYNMANIVVVFDFDRTIIDDDSDNWVVTQMGMTKLFNQLRSTLPWNSLMDRMMKELHSQGKTVEDIANCLRQCPLDSWMVAAIKSARSLGCDLKIVSDANQFFIETILEHHGLLSCFSEIYTNPTFVDEEGRLWILPYHGSTLSAHGCNLCPSNLCKGLVLDHFYTSALGHGKPRSIYLGDGRGDFCPTLKLRNGDYVMPRKNYPLWDRICSNQMLIKAEVHEWSNAEELQKVLLHLINTISTEENIGSNKSSHPNSAECYSQTMLVRS